MGGIAANGKIDSKREVVTHLIVQIHFSFQTDYLLPLTFVILSRTVGGITTHKASWLKYFRFVPGPPAVVAMV